MSNTKKESSKTRVFNQFSELVKIPPIEVPAGMLLLTMTLPKSKTIQITEPLTSQTVLCAGENSPYSPGDLVQIDESRFVRNIKGKLHEEDIEGTGTRQVVRIPTRKLNGLRYFFIHSHAIDFKWKHSNMQANIEEMNEK